MCTQPALGHFSSTFPLLYLDCIAGLILQTLEIHVLWIQRPPFGEGGVWFQGKSQEYLLWR